MNILLFGKNGQVGWELQRTLAPLGEVTSLDYPEVNFADPEGLGRVVEEARPDVIVNAAAYTAVDKAENEPELARAINAAAPGLLAAVARARQAAIIHYSTEYVFDGRKGQPYTESDTPNPLNLYGLSKLEGERAVQEVGGAHLVLRTSWVYSTRVGGFVNKVLGWSRQQKTMRVVEDQVGNPTWCRMLAEATAHLLAMSRRDPYGWIGEHAGLYHLAGSGHASRLEWAEAILNYDPARGEQAVEKIEPAFTKEFPSPAERPLYSPLNCDLFKQTFGYSLPNWKKALQLAMDSS
jgi:dTDP-4-dehydrorhamnose reductase